MNYKKSSFLALLMLLTVGLMAQRPSGYKLKLGDQFRVTVTIKQNIEQTMLGQTMETKQTISTVDLYEVVAVTSEGYKMRTTGLSRSLNTETGGGSVTMDSGMEGDDHLAFRVLTGKSYYVTMNQYGRFLSLEGMDSFNSAVKTELEGTALEDQSNELLAGFDEAILSTSFNGQFYIYPEPEVPWERTVKSAVNGLPVSVTYDFSWKDNNTILATGDMTMSGELESMGQIMTADMAGTQTSEFKLDAATGLATIIKTLQDMDGSLELQGISVPMVLNTEVTVRITK